MSDLRDRHGRVVEYMRVSLTEHCNYACPFCMPSGASSCPNAGPRLSSGEILGLCRVFSGLGVSNFKITGGEPLLYPDALPVLMELKRLPGVRCVTVTTNGSTLRRDAPRLADAGVDGVNVSLNAFTPHSYRLASGSNFPVSVILENILAARALGLNVKLNMVPVRGINDEDIVSVADFALTHGIHLRFIELMPIAEGRKFEAIPRAEIMNTIARFGRVEVSAERFGNGPATYYSLDGRETKIGYIAAVSERFCGTCNRIRLSSTGFLKTCLHHNHGVDLGRLVRNGADDDELRENIRQAVAGKPAGHEFFHESGDGMGTTPMYRIGG